METNLLYYGDNLDILRRYIPDESSILSTSIRRSTPNGTTTSFSKTRMAETRMLSSSPSRARVHWGPNAENVYAYLTEQTSNIPASLSSTTRIKGKAISLRRRLFSRKGGRDRRTIWLADLSTGNQGECRQMESFTFSAQESPLAGMGSQPSTHRGWWPAIRRAARRSHGFPRARSTRASSRNCYGRVANCRLVRCQALIYRLRQFES